jgi:hypothetical protein
MGKKKDYSKDGNYQYYFHRISDLVYGYSRYGRFIGGGKKDFAGRGRKRIDKRVEELLREVDSWK